MDDRLRADPEVQLLSRVYRDLQRPGPEGCPDPDRLVRLVLGEMEGEERYSLVDHVVSCGRCSGEYAFLLDAHAQSVRETSAAGKRGRIAWGLAALAAALVAIGASLLLLRSTGRGAADRDVVRSASTAQRPRVTPPQDSVLSEPPPVFSWPPEGDAPSYRFRLFDAESQPIWTSEAIGEPRVPLPTGAAKELQRGATYFWYVDVESERGRTRLGPFWFGIEK